MAQPAAVLSILITANNKQATAALTKTQTQLSATSKAAAATGVAMRRLGTAAKWGGLALAGGMTIGLKKSVDEAREANKVMAQTDAVIKSTGGAAKVTAEQVAALSERLSEKAGMDDELIQSGANLLLTFKNIRNEAGKNNDIFDQTTAIALDMSAALGQDMKSSAIQLGKALNDPTVGLTALRRVGVSFNETQAETIQRLFESGERLEAQKRILRELRSEFQGSARANADAGDRLRVVFDNLAEDIGMKVVPQLEKMASKVSNVLSNRRLTGDQKAERLANYFTRLFSKGLDALTAALPAIAEAGGRIGLKLVGSIGKAFMEADIWGQLFLAATFLRLIGGPGVLGKLGKTVGATLGKSAGRWFAAGFMLALPALVKEAGDFLNKHLGGLLGNENRIDFGEGTVTLNGKTLNAEEYFKQQRDLARDHSQKIKGINQSLWDDLRGVADKGLERTNAITIRGLGRQQGEFDRTRGKIDAATKGQAKDVAANIASMVNAVGRGLSTLVQNTNEALRAFGAKRLSFAAKSVGSNVASGAEKAAKLRSGGFAGVVPGVGSGDKVPLQAMVEPGEGLFVLNRNAMGALQALNDRFPRFQTGGGLQPGISRLARWAADRYGLRVSSGLRLGDPGHHGRGEAVDLVPPSMGATKGIFGAFRNQLAELFYDPWGGWDEGRHIGAIGGHLDHIHAAIRGAGGPAAIARRLSRVLLEGPKGPLRSMGQGALDKAYAAANRHLASQSMMGHGNLGIANIKGPLQGIARRLVEARWGAGQWPFFNDLVMRESGWDPSAVNPSSGAAGLAQALPPSKYPPGAWPYTGKSSAVKQLQWMVNYISGRYGNPAGAIAFHNANNWYQQGGALLPYLGKFHSGGVAAREGLAHVDRGEAMIPRLQRGGSITALENLLASLQPSGAASKRFAGGVGPGPDSWLTLWQREQRAEARERKAQVAAERERNAELRSLIRELIANQRRIMQSSRKERSAINAAIAAAASGQMGQTIQLESNTPVAGSLASY